jgi:anaerobic ribonucleoside-triphosphate reductase activating protein
MSDRKARDDLNLSHYVERTKVLGPYVRSALWVQGCPFSCPGCLSPKMRGPGGFRMDCGALAELLLSIEGTEGLTISGGEPFLQAGPLRRVLRDIRRKADYGVIVYTGFTLEELIAGEESEAALLLKEIDILIDGRYVAELDDGRPYRGSSNQRLHQLSGRYADVFDAYYNLGHGRRVEFNIGSGRTTMVGIPSKAALRAWERLQNAQGALAHSRSE